MKESIQIELDDNIQSIVARIQESESDEIDLIVPTGSRVLQNIVDAHLIREAGTEAGKRITVVTSDLMGRVFAERAGLAVSVQSTYGNKMVITQAVSTGRISDIVPRKKISSLSGPKKTAVPDKAVRVSKTTAKSAAKRISTTASENMKKKGEVGASFLRSYREERAQSDTDSFKELKKINRRGKISFGRWPFNFRINTFSLIWIVLAVALAVGIFVFTKTLPRANVTIYPVREPRVETVTVSISSKDAKADLDKGIIPGELLTAEKETSGSFAATGEKNVSEKAKGKITIFNSYSTQPQQFVPSRFQSEDGKIFWTVKSISVPGSSVKDGKTIPGQMTTDVVAAEPGETYNIDPGKFTMPALKKSPRAGKIYATSDSPMIGGKTGQSKVVAAADATKAYTELKEKLKSQFDDFKKNLPEGFEMWSEAYNEELADNSVSPDVGQSAENFEARVKVIARAVVFKKDNLNEYVNRQISSNLEDGRIPLLDSKEISFMKAPVVDYQKGSVSAVLQVKYDLINRIDADSFKSEVLRKKEKDIKRILSVFKNIERVEVNLWPFWVRTVPANPERVNIKVYGL